MHSHYSVSQLQRCSKASDRLSALHKLNVCSSFLSNKLLLEVRSLYLRHYFRLTPCDAPSSCCSKGQRHIWPAGGFPMWIPGHRKLKARARVRMAPMSIRKGSQVFRKPAQLDQTQRWENKCEQTRMWWQEERLWLWDQINMHLQLCSVLRSVCK